MLERPFEPIIFFSTFLVIISVCLIVAIQLQCLSFSSANYLSISVILAGSFIVASIGVRINSTRQLWGRNCPNSEGGLYPPFIIIFTLLIFIFMLFLVFGCVP